MFRVALLVLNFGNQGDSFAAGSALSLNLGLGLAVDRLKHLGRKHFRISVERPLVFVHVPKSAGTSVHDFLIESMSREALAPPRQIEDFHSIPLGYLLYSGHMCLNQWAPIASDPHFVSGSGSRWGGSYRHIIFSASSRGSILTSRRTFSNSVI